VTEAVASAGAGYATRGARSVRDAWGGFGDALHAEWTKLRTLASTWWLLLAVAALTVVVRGGGRVRGGWGCGRPLPPPPPAAVYRCSGGPVACAPAATGADPAKLSLTGVYLGQVIVALFAVQAVGGEYGTGMIRVTLAATPRRLSFLAAKALVVTGWALAAAVVAVAGSLLAGRLILPGHGLSAANGYVVPSLVNGADLRAFGGSVLYFALIALLALGVTIVVRDSGVAIGLVLGLLYLFTIVAMVIPNKDLSRHLQQIAPMTAGMEIQATVGVAALPLTPWQGLGVLALWAVGALVLGAAVLRLRDA
jgi:ABC-2 type transport system permease protein